MTGRPPSSCGSGTSTTSAGGRDNLGRVLYRRTKDDLKTVGVYSSREEVEAAAERKRGFPGFCDELQCFFVTECPLDTHMWPDGFLLEKPPRPAPTTAE